MPRTIYPVPGHPFAFYLLLSRLDLVNIFLSDLRHLINVEVVAQFIHHGIPGLVGHPVLDHCGKHSAPPLVDIVVRLIPGLSLIHI